MLERLQQRDTVAGMFAEASELARIACDFDRCLVLRVESDLLIADSCGALKHRPSDRLRRELMQAPRGISPRTLEARWLTEGLGGQPAERPLPSSLERPELALGYVSVGAIAPDGKLVAVLAGTRSDRPIDVLTQAMTAGIAAMVGVALARLVLSARLVEVRGTLRHLSMSADTLITEVLRSSIQVPIEGASGPRFPVEEASSRPSNRAREILTDREIEVASLLVDGRSDREIAARLVISVNTVKDHVARLRGKLGASNRVEAASKYLRLIVDDAGR
ncbi:hypothetical protein DSM112329_04222 [Paraconexibacter sp. AEG42_29]|uniref:HTH luxR-type domain-containing protein n=2 Tax=Paraconexibacter sp. AEG42_29 TaxID=2997339 RepID=A0AAU7B0E4_9ACTN